MSQESTGIHWLLSDTNFILSSTIKIESEFSCVSVEFNLLIRYNICK